MRDSQFEQMMINEIKSLNSYKMYEIDFHFWRTLAGNEVDLILSRAREPFSAIEFKNKKKISSKDLSGLRSFSEEFPSVQFLYCVCNVDLPYKQDNITIVPWEYFLKKELLKIVKR